MYVTLSGNVFNLTEKGDTNEWVTYSASIILSVVLFEIILMLLMVICRRRQIRKKEKDEGHVYIVRKYTRRESNSSESNPWGTATHYENVLERRDKLHPQQFEMDTTRLTTVTPTATQAPVYDERTHIALDALSGIAEQKNTEEQAKKQKVLRKEEMSRGQDDFLGIRDNATKAEGHVSDNHNRGPGSVLSALKTVTDIGQSGDNAVENKITTRIHVNDPVRLRPENSNSEMERAYEELDELQKQIHILSKSIPILDVYGYEEVDKIRPVPKASRSIPTLLNAAGYEDIDTIKLKPTLLIPKSERVKVKDMCFSVDSCANKTAAQFLPATHESASPHPVRSDFTHGGLQEKITAQKQEKDPVYSIVQKRKKASGVSDTDLVSSYTETPPPVPPQTVEALCMAGTVEQPMNVSSHVPPAQYTKVRDYYYHGSDPNISLSKTECDSNNPQQEMKATVYSNICKLSNEELYIDL